MDSIIQNGTNDLPKVQHSDGGWQLKTRFIPSASLESLVIVQPEGQKPDTDEHLLVVPQVTLAAILERLSSNAADTAARHQPPGFPGGEVPAWLAKTPGSAQPMLAAENTLREFERAAAASANIQQQGAVGGGGANAHSPTRSLNQKENSMKSAFDSVVSDMQTAMRQPAVAEKFEQVASLGNSLKEKLKTHATRAVAMLQSPQANRGTSPSRASLEPPNASNRRSMVDSVSSEPPANAVAGRSQPPSASATPTHVPPRVTPPPVLPGAAAAAGAGQEPKSPNPSTGEAVDMGVGVGVGDSSKNSTPRLSSSSAMFTMFPLSPPPLTAPTDPTSSTTPTPQATPASGAVAAVSTSGAVALRSSQVDTKSCVQFLLDLFQQWFGVFTPDSAEKLPIPLAIETITSVHITVFLISFMV